MSTMEDRKNTFENKFAHDEAVMFKVEARACKLFGLWIAEQIGLDENTATSYAGEVIAANLEEPGFDDVIRKVRPDIDAKGLDITDHVLNTKLDGFMEEAKLQIVSEIE